jgi:hypothetical protein
MVSRHWVEGTPEVPITLVLLQSWEEESESDRFNQAMALDHIDSQHNAAIPLTSNAAPLRPIGPKLV